MVPTHRPEPGFLSRQVTRARRFYFGLEPDRGEGALEVAGGGWELVARDYTIHRATFPWLSIEFVAGGSGRLTIGGVSHALQRSTVFSYGPGVPHRIETDPDQPLSKHYLNFRGREAEDLLATLGLAPGCCRPFANADEIEDGIEALIDEGAADQPQAPAIAGLQLRILFLKMTGSGPAVNDAETSARHTLRRCVAYIDRHFLELRTIEEAAAACHVSVGHLTRAFARFGQGSPYRYLTRKKMVHAARLLDSGSFLVGEVADRLGLDPFQFSRVFKRIHGISPSEFKNRHGNTR
jgi:AraC-like DNA-binding protein